ncbi:MAG: DUF4404 family protein [Gammaproteobacteria bacterium]
MDSNSLRDHLAKVHAELTEALRADPKSRETLNDMMLDINRLIDKPADMTASSQGSLPGRLERIAVQFEADHPTLAASARRLVDLLGEVGI